MKFLIVLTTVFFFILGLPLFLFGFSKVEVSLERVIHEGIDYFDVILSVNRTPEDTGGDKMADLVYHLLRWLFKGFLYILIGIFKVVQFLENVFKLPVRFGNWLYDWACVIARIITHPSETFKTFMEGFNSIDVQVKVDTKNGRVHETHLDVSRSLPPLTPPPKKESEKIEFIYEE